MQLPFAVVDAKSASAFARRCVRLIGLCYHPDNPFSDYIGGTGRPLFSQIESEYLDLLTDRSFSFCGDRLYEIAEAQQRMLFERE